MCLFAYVTAMQNWLAPSLWTLFVRGATIEHSISKVNIFLLNQCEPSSKYLLRLSFTDIFQGIYEIHSLSLWGILFLEKNNNVGIINFSNKMCDV